MNVCTHSAQIPSRSSADSLRNQTNSEGEHFQCLIPALKKPLHGTWLDVPQVPAPSSPCTASYAFSAPAVCCLCASYSLQAWH